ncbi:MAG: hypothetical protein BWY19_00775 [bacterium ADurb.Bin212]|nr:MAG: hypothetical protein BWY19_00775 [bacterium ADurb.Bin212]
MTSILAIQTFLICFNGQLYSTESDISFSTSSRIVDIRNAIDLKTKCDPDETENKLKGEE